MVAPPKTNRKLRKERKNRAKKVCLLLFTTSTSFLTRRFSVPWYQKGQGFRAPEEGQVRVGRIVLFGSSVASHSMHIRTSQKLSAAVSYHLCPLSLSSTAHELYAHADILSLCAMRWAGVRAPVSPETKHALRAGYEDVRDSIRSAHYMSGIIAKTVYGLPMNQRERKERRPHSETQFLVNDVWILLILLCRYPHLFRLLIEAFQEE